MQKESVVVTGVTGKEAKDWASEHLRGNCSSLYTPYCCLAGDDIDYEGVPVSPYCTKPEQADTWFKAMKKAQEMCGSTGGQARRAVPDGERTYLDALVRGVYARRDLAKGEVLTADDVFLAVPLTAGAVAGSVVAIAAPWLAAIAAISGLAAKLKLEVVREAPPDTPPPSSRSDGSTSGS